MSIPTSQTSQTIHPSALLRFALRADGAVSLVAGVLTCALLQPLQPVLGAHSEHILVVGIFMAAYGLAVGLLSWRIQMDRRLISGIVFGNACWVLASIILLMTPWIHPTTLGIMLILAQAAAVALLTAMQYAGLRNSERVHASLLHPADLIKATLGH